MFIAVLPDRYLSVTVYGSTMQQVVKEAKKWLRSSQYMGNIRFSLSKLSNLTTLRVNKLLRDMPYNKFDLQTLVADFNLEIIEDTRLFPNIQPVEPSDLLKTILEENTPLATAINTEKARGELIIFPILLEVKRKINFKISVFSGKEFNVDVERGLNGNPDFLISRNREQFFITAPVITLVEAKNQDINSGLGQCGAEMIAAQIYNAKKNNGIDCVFGCVTTGALWRFLRLENQTLYIDKVEISLEPIERLLGIFLQIIK